MPTRQRRQRLRPAAIPLAPTEPAVAAAEVLARRASPDAIAQRAYAIYERRGGDDGRALDDWLQAKREIQAED